ncbi:hypothetical protein [Photorhabdus viridis]|uniref:hypothetical protein n=1 Tax=Photorhabdus viridis TaxID=3163327 RepID=UPI003307BA41
MSHKNDFRDFPISNNANVVSQERYEESKDLLTGFPPQGKIVNILLKKSDLTDSNSYDLILSF